MKRASLAGLLMAWILSGVAPDPASAQTRGLEAGASLASRYVWRGVPYSSTVQFQPWVSASLGSLEIGVWGSYGLDGDYKEQNHWLTWTVPARRGSLSISLTDYYFTEDYGDFFDWGGVENGVPTGAHTLEATVTWTGTETRPLRILLASTFYNDPAASVYGAVGYSLERAGVSWAAEAGYLFRDGGYYELGESGLTNLSLSATRSLGSAGPFEAFATGRLVHDPLLDSTFLVLELGF